jgi:poly(3-hydroxybutyrate) depolymerase
VITYRAVGALLLVALAVGSAPAVHASGEHAFRLPSGWVYAAKAPAGYRPVMVVVLHSRGKDWREPAVGGWSALADARRFVAVYPVAPDGSWNAGLCCGPASMVGRDDGRYLAEVIADARRRWPVQRVYLAGTSNGGMMVERLVAERPWLTARAAVWGSAPQMPRPGRWSGRLWIGHGAGDTVVPWGGAPSVAWCGCPIRPAQATRTYLPAARLGGHLYAGVGHAAPAWWPAAAWASFGR